MAQGPDRWADSYSIPALNLQPSAIRALFAVAARPEVVSLAGGMPYVAALPIDEIAQTVGDMLRSSGDTALQYGAGQGTPLLRELILDVMKPAGISATADDVLVTAGSQLAMDLLVSLFVDPGDVVLVESPTYVGAIGVFARHLADVRHVPTTQDGLDPAALEEAIEQARSEGKRVKLIYTIPTFQNPGGTCASAASRAAILTVAQQHGVLLLEDDPYGLLGFDELGSTAIPQAIRSLDDEGVVYLGSFSKTIASGFRVGWAVAPKGIMTKLILAAEAATLCPSHFTQYTISEYLQHHDWRGQIDTFRGIYKQRRDAMLGALTQHMPTGTTWTEPQGGFYTWVRLPGGLDTQELLPKAVESRVAYVPGTGFHVDGGGRDAMRLSFCYPTPEQITLGVERLGQVVTDALSAT